MARNIKFPLVMKGEIEVRTKSELLNNFSLFDVIENIKNGKLVIWLRNILEDDIADSVEKLDLSDPELGQKICTLFDVDYNEDIEKSNQDTMIRKEKLSKLVEFSDDDTYVKVIDSIAFTQDDLFDLVSEGIKEIYLCGEKFEIPLSRGNIKYIGINCPQVIICSKEKVDWNEKNIIFENTVFDEKYRLIEEKTSNIEEIFLDQLVEKVKKEKCNEPKRLTKEDIQFLNMILERVEEFHNLEVDMDHYCDDLETEEIDADDYDNEEYDYSTKSQAKHACKEQIVIMIDAAKRIYADVREDKKSELVSAYQDLDETINTFINDFFVELDDVIEFADSEISERLKNIRGNIEIIKTYNEYEFEEKVAKFIDLFLAKEFSCKKKVNEYLSQCDFDDDGEMYSYDLSSCADDLSSELYDSLDGGLVNAKKVVEMIYDDVKDVLGINVFLAVMKEYGIDSEVKAVDIDFNQIGEISNSLIKKISTSTVVAKAVAKKPLSTKKIATIAVEEPSVTRKTILKNADIWSKLYDELNEFVENAEKNADSATSKRPTLTKKANTKLCKK